MRKSVTIPMELFGLLIKYHVLGLADQTDSEAIQAALVAKVEAMERRDVYTQSKTASTAEEREAARRKYLDLAGIPDDYRR